MSFIELKSIFFYPQRNGTAVCSWQFPLCNVNINLRPALLSSRTLVLVFVCLINSPRHGCFGFDI